MILITGATGSLGRNLVQKLLNENVEVRILTRSSDMKSCFWDANVEIVIGNLSQEASLYKAVDGVDCVFSIPPNAINQAELETNLFNISKRAGVNRIVKLSSAKVDINSRCHFFREHALAEQHLVRSDVPHTILRSNSFMQNLFWFKEEIKLNGTFSLPMRDSMIAPVDISDIVAFAACILIENGHEDKTYNITGGEKFSLFEMSKMFSSVLKKKVSYIDIEPKEFADILVKKGASGWFSNEIVAAWQVACQSYPVVTDIFEHIMKRKPTTFTQFIQKHVNVWE